MKFILQKNILKINGQFKMSLSYLHHTTLQSESNKIVVAHPLDALQAVKYLLIEHPIRFRSE